MKNAKGETITPGQWYNFGGNISFRVTGTKRETLYMRNDTLGKIRKASGYGAGRDAIASALYNATICTGYAAYNFGRDNVDVGNAPIDRFH